MHARLRKKEYWVSLKTSDRSEALRLAGVATEQKRQDISMMFHRLEGFATTITEMTTDLRLALKSDAFREFLSGNSDLVAEFKASGSKTVSAFVAARKSTIQELIVRLRSENFANEHIKLYALKLTIKNGIRVPDDSGAYPVLLQIVGEAIIEARQHELAQFEGHFFHQGADPSLIDSVTGVPRSIPSPREVIAKPVLKQESLTELSERYLSNPNRIRTEKTKASIRGYLSVVFEILGDNTAPDRISESDCEHVRDLIAQLPPNFKKLAAIKDRPVEEMARIARLKSMPRLSPTGVNNYLKNLIAFLSWCHRKGKIDRMPTAFSEIKVADPVRKEDKRLPFSNEQLATIFHSEVFLEEKRNDCLFWVPLIALWNGMRSNEICQLDTVDVKMVDGIWGFDVTYISSLGDDDKRVKTGSSIRMIPIHPRLIEFGFIDFHKSRPKNQKLFGDITRGHDGYYSTTFSKRANRYLKAIGAHGPKHKFHSFRHTFRDALRRGRVDREIGKALGGWQRGNTDAFDIYGSGYPLDELHAEIRLVNYSNIEWSHLVING
jgi:integrase